MDNSVLDTILHELKGSGTDKVELTEEWMNSLQLEDKNQRRNDYLNFLETQGLVHRETIVGFTDIRGEWHNARYFMGLTPKGLKFISDGGFLGEAGYAKKTLQIATQSRNWAIVGVGIAVVAILLQVYYGGCTQPTNGKDNKPIIPSTKIDTGNHVAVDSGANKLKRKH